MDGAKPNLVALNQWFLVPNEACSFRAKFIYYLIKTKVFEI